MGYPVFPSMPGIMFPVERGAEVQGTELQAFSGRNTWLPDWPYPLYHFQVSFSVLRSAANFLEWQTMLGFWNSVKTTPGGYFLFDDPNDDSVTTQGLGSGDGTTKTFTLVRSLGGFSEPVFGYFNTNPATAFLDYGAVNVAFGASLDYGAVNASATAFLDYSSSAISNTHFYVNGSEVPAVINTDGTVTFATAPTAGQPITWTGSFYWLCQFEDTTIDISNFMSQLFEIKQLKFKSVRL